MSKEEVESELHEYARTINGRDNLIHRALRAGITKNRIHTITRISRSTIDRILKENSMTSYKAVLSATPEPGDSGTHIALICTWEDGLGEEMARIDTGVAYGTDGYDAAKAKDAAEEKFAELGWSVGAWTESGGDWYADATGDPEEDGEEEDDEADQYDTYGERKPSREENALEDAIEEGEDEEEYWNP